MRPSRRELLVAVVALAACGRGQPAPYQTALTEPWSALGLPVDGGRVVYSDERFLNVHYEGGEVEALATLWSEALLKGGLTRQADSSGADMKSVTFSGPDAVVALGVIRAPERVEVSLTRYPRS